MAAICLRSVPLPTRTLQWTTPTTGRMPFLVYTIVVLLVLGSGTLVGQPEQSLDSLKRLLQQSTDDQQRVELYHTLAQESVHTNFEAFEQYIQQSIDLAKQIQDLKGLNAASYTAGKVYYLNGYYDKAVPYLQQVREGAVQLNDTFSNAKALNILGLIHGRKGNYETSIDFYLQSLTLRQQLRDSASIGLVYANIATIYKTQGAYQEALDYYRKALKIAQETQRDQGMASVYNGMGLVYQQQGKYGASLSMFLKALKIYEKTNDARGMVASYGNIGIIHDIQNNSSQALKYYLKAIELNNQQPTSNLQTLALIYNNVGIVYYGEGKHEKALEFHFKSLKIKAQQDNKTGMVYSYENIGRSYFYQNKTEEALEYLEKGLRLSQEIGSKSMSAISLVLLGELYAGTAQYPKAKKYLSEGIELAEKIGDPATILKSVGILAKVEQTLGNYQAAYGHQVRYKNLSDSLLSLEKSKQIADLTAQYESEKREQHIENLEQSTKIKDLQLRQFTLSLMVLSVVLVLFVLVGVVLYLFYRQKQFQLQKKHHEVEQKLLRVQMNPHFIFNALAVIQQYMFEASSQKASFYLAKFAKLMRQVLEHSRHEYIPLEEEISMLDHYLSLQNLRQKQPFEYQIVVDERIDPEAIAIPPMFAQPFVENAIEHGISHMATQGRIDIDFKLDGEQIILTIQDNGVGLHQAKSKNTKHQSLATQITKERLSIFKQNHKKDVDFKLESLDQGTKITFYLPYQYL